MDDKKQMLKEMKAGVGASETPILLLGNNFGKDTEYLYSLKRGHIEAEDISDSPDIKRGNKMEDTAIQCFEEQTGTEVIYRQELFAEGPILCHLDGAVLEGGDLAPVEIKCPKSYRVRKIKDEGVPDYQQIQLQQQMYLTDAHHGYMAYFNADTWDVHIVDVPRNDAIIDIIVDRINLFWDGVLAGEMVEFASIEPPVKLGAQAKEVDDQIFHTLRELERQKAELEETILSSKEEIRKMWPEDTRKVYGSFGSISMVKTRQAEKFNKKRFKDEEPEIYKKYASPGGPDRISLRTSWKKEG